MVLQFILILSGLFSLVYAVGAPAPLEALELVEEDQVDRSNSSHDIFNRNIALGSMRDYTDVSSYRRGSFGHFAHDGDKETAWVLGEGQSSGTIEISWGLAVPVNRIDVSEMYSESIQALTLELYDGKQWERIEPLHPSVRNRLRFKTRLASAVRIRIQCDEKPAGIAEVEVYNTESLEPLPRYGSAALVEAMRACEAVILYDGSPYAYGRRGRALIQPRDAAASLADPWVLPVLEYITTELAGAIQAVDGAQVMISLNAKSFTLDVGPEAKVLEQVKALAMEGGLEWFSHQGVVIVGFGLEVLRQETLIAELTQILGRNPYHVGDESKKMADAVVTPTLNKEGITYEWAGFRSSADPDTNSDAWLKYSETKAIRSWRNVARDMIRYAKPPERVTTLEQFESYRAQIRAAPETNTVVNMSGFTERFHADLFAEFNIYNQLGIDVINQTGPKHWPDTLHDDLRWWAATYALTYYLAKNYGVVAHQFGNEPDSYFNTSTGEQVARRLTLIADAIHAAIEDVNRDWNRDLRAIYSAPVLASDFKGRNARIMMRNLYTRYDGSKSPSRLVQLFNRHRYSGRPHQNVLEVQQAKQMMQEEAGELLPQVFTELNYSTGRNWARPHTDFTNDTPTVFTSIASIWGWMMQEQGVYGIFVFKLNDPRDLGPFSNKITYSIDPERDSDASHKKLPQISYGTKNFEVCRLFGKGFHGSRPLLQTVIECSDSQYRSWTTVDEPADRFYIWSVQVNDFETYEIEFDLSELQLPQDALISVETVSGARHGEMTHLMTLAEDQKVRVQQAPQSAMLLTVHRRALSLQSLGPAADASVTQGKHAGDNFGDEAWLEVARHRNSDANKISFVRFELPEAEVNSPVERAVLELHGQSKPKHAYDGGFLFRVYANESDDWDELGITAENAPNIYRTVAALKKININNYPVGHVTAFKEPSSLRVDVTQAIREARERGVKEISFVLIRERYWVGENTDFHSARLSAREDESVRSPILHVWD